jgi:hypothetical protein
MAKLFNCFIAKLLRAQGGVLNKTKANFRIKLKFLPSDLSLLDLSLNFSYFTKYHREAQSFTELLNC